MMPLPFSLPPQGRIIQVVRGWHFSSALAPPSFIPEFHAYVSFAKLCSIGRWEMSGYHIPMNSIVPVTVNNTELGGLNAYACGFLEGSGIPRWIEQYSQEFLTQQACWWRFVTMASSSRLQSMHYIHDQHMLLCLPERRHTREPGGEARPTYAPVLGTHGPMITLRFSWLEVLVPSMTITSTRGHSDVPLH